MKYFLSIAVCVLLSSAQARAEDLLYYSYGSQILGSVLEVDGDGRIKHTERSCCPPASVNVVEKDLLPLELAEVKSLIVLAAQGTIEEKKCPAALGAYYGTFFGFTEQADQVDLRSDLIGSSFADCTTKINTSEAAKKLTDFVFNYVTVQVPNL